MNSLSILDNTQPITLRHHLNESTTEISTALIRRYRHRRYSQVIDSPVPVNFAHWYFANAPHPNPRQSGSDLPEGDGAITPLPGNEIIESDGTVWTILEVNLSPLTGVWQTVCETFVFAEPTEHVAHLRQDVAIAESLPVRVGTKTTTFEPEFSERLTFFVREPIIIEPNDVFRRSDDTQWRIVRVERPANHARWTVVVGVR
jgi:hypothetical protein